MKLLGLLFTNIKIVEMQNNTFLELLDLKEKNFEFIELQNLGYKKSFVMVICFEKANLKLKKK